MHRLSRWAPRAPPIGAQSCHGSERAAAVICCANGRDEGGGGSNTRASGSGTSGSGSSGAAAGAAAGGASEPLVLSPKDSQRPSAPLKRSSYRRKSKTDEQRRAERAAQEAEVKEYSRAARYRVLDEDEAAAAARNPSSSGRRARGPTAAARPLPQQVVLVDGYNVIYGTAELKRLAGFRLEDARTALNGIAEQYGKNNAARVCVVYDAMGAPPSLRAWANRRERVGAHALAIYATHSEADTYIARAVARLKKRGVHEVIVVSNDRLVRDDALDERYVSYAMSPELWLQRASSSSGTAAAAAQGYGSGRRASMDEYAAFLRSRPPRQGAAGEREAPTPLGGGGVLPSSRDLEEEAMRLVLESSSSSGDDEYEAADGWEGEGSGGEGSGYEEWWWQEGSDGDEEASRGGEAASVSGVGAVAHAPGEASPLALAGPVHVVGAEGDDADAGGGAAASTSGGAGSALGHRAGSPGPPQGEPPPPLPSAAAVERAPGQGLGSDSLFGRGGRARLKSLLKRGAQ